MNIRLTTYCFFVIRLGKLERRSWILIVIGRIVFYLVVMAIHSA